MFATEECGTATPERCAFRYRLKPSRAQRIKLERMASARRFAYNWALERWREYHAEFGKTIPFKQLLRELTGLKRQPGLTWLAEVDSQLLQQALFDLRQAYRNFFERRARYPRFKSRKSDSQRFRIPQRVRIEGGSVYVPKIGWIRFRLSRPFIGAPKSATFKRDAIGHWYVTLVSEFELATHSIPPPSLADMVGIDLGVVDLAVLSNGTRIPAPRFAGAERRGLRRAHRELSRKQRGSANRARAQQRLARLYWRTADQRNDFLHKLTTDLIRNHDVIAIEDLGVAGLARTKLAGALLDAGLSEFRRQLTYKARWKRKHLVVIDRFYPSSKRCGICGAVNADLPPRARLWTCECGATHDRDLNAARNIRDEAIRALVAVGRTDTENAGGARVRPPMGAASAEAGIPIG